MGEGFKGVSRECWRSGVSLKGDPYLLDMSELCSLPAISCRLDRLLENKESCGLSDGKLW